LAVKNKTKAQLVDEQEKFLQKIANLEKIVADLRLKEDLFYQLTEHSPFPVMIYSHEGKMDYINTSFTKLFGYTIKDISDRFTWREKAYPNPRYRKQIEKEVKASDSSEKKGFWGVERRITCADGSTREGMLYSLHLPNGKYYVIIADITDLKKSQNALAESRERFRRVYKYSPVPAFLWQREGDDFTLIDYSNSAEAFTDSKMNSHVGRKFKPLFRDMPQIAEDMERCFSQRTVVQNEHPYRIRTTKEMKDVATFYTFIPPDLVLAHIVDITGYKSIERSLRESQEKLQIEARRLEEANTALKVLLEYRGEEKRKVHENVTTAVTRLILPFVEKLGNSSLDNEQRVFLDTIKSNLAEITTPLATKLSYRYAGLSPSEFAVANLVREGKSIKESADLLNVTEDTIRVHRKNIRVKLGIKHKKINLHSFLQQLSKE
jgi:PAS domain S-box-containing protein